MSPAPQKFPSLLPGLILTAALAWFSTWISDLVGLRLMGFEKSPISPVMTAIILGLMISNLLRLPERLKPGISFAVGKLLRLGIILLGVRLSVVEVFRLGAVGVPIVLGCIAGALFFTLLLARALQLPEKLGTLIAVGTSICGVSAIVAAGPAIESEEEEMAYAVSVITIFGLVATIAYPYLAHLIFAGDPVRAGLFMGTAVHDTSQVTGAALLYADIYSRPEALNVAVVTKLVRNIFMALVIPFMTYYYARRSRPAVAGAQAGSGGEDAADASRGRFRLARFFPLFILGFLIMALLRSVGDLTLSGSGAAFGLFDREAWTAGHGFLRDWAVNFLVVALAGVGLSTRFRALRHLGLKPFLTGLLAAAVVGLISYLLILALGRFVVAL